MKKSNNKNYSNSILKKYQGILNNIKERAFYILITITMKTLKKVIAWASALTLIAMNSVFAADIGTITWGTWTTVNPDDSALPTSTWSTQVYVSAYIAPVLSMSLDTNTIAFWTLDPATPNTQSVNLTTATNAEGWITIGMAATWLASSTKSIWSLVKWGTVATAAADSYEVDSSTNAGWTALGLSNVAGSQTILTANDVVESNATTTVNLTATAEATTEAWNYSDTLTFTVTGTF